MRTHHIVRVLFTAIFVLGGAFPASGTLAAGPVAALSVTGLPSAATAGAPNGFTVTAVDANGASVSSYTGTVTFSSNFPSATVPANYTFTAADAGKHVFSATFFEVGAEILTVMDTSSTAIYGTGTLNITPANAVHYTISNLTNGSALSAGVPASFNITASDQWYNVATSYNGSAVVTSSDPAAVLPPNPVFTSGQVTGVKITFNTAGGQSVTATDVNLSSMTDTAWATISAAPNSTITAASNVTTGAAGLVASVPSQTGVTYAWSITNGTITTGQGTNQITYSAGAVGTLSLQCVVTRTATGGRSTGNKNETVVAAPVTPVITAKSPVTAATTGNTAAVTARTGMTYQWSINGGTITSSTAGVTSNGVNTVTYTSGGVGSLTLTAVEINAAGSQSAPGTASVSIIAAPTTPTITAPAAVTTGTTGNTASVTARAGMTYVWTISGGTISSAGGAAGVTANGINTITFTAGAVGTLSLTAAEVNAANTASAAATATVTVTAVPGMPTQPVITAASAVTAGTSGNSASVTARAGMTYQWSITGGTITSAGGASGVTSNGVNTISYTAGPVGTLTLSAIEINSQNQQSSPATASVSVVAAPSVPSITAPNQVTGNSTGNSASVVARTGMTYQWTINGGSITSAGGPSGVTTAGSNSITFTAAASGNVSLTAVEVNAAGTVSAPASVTITIIASATAGGHLYTVAHQDDDIYFMNPDLEKDIQAGVPFRMVFFMAAGWPSASAWQTRENAIKNSYATMANVANNWTCGSQQYAGNPVQQCSLNGVPNVSLIFLRMPDGNLNQLWATTTGAPFYVSPATTMQNADNSATYTHSSLIQTVGAIISSFAPSRIGTLDSTFGYGFPDQDHMDHESSGLFSLEAAHTYTSPYEMRIYRGYTMDGPWYSTPAPEVVNLSTAEYNEKYRIAAAYDGGPPLGSTWDNFIHRQYVIEKVPGGTGPLVEPGGRCLDTAGGSATSGTAIVLNACNGSLSQRWTIRVDSEITGIGGQCLTIGSDGASTQIAACSGTAQQRWTLFSNGQLRGAGATCLTVAADAVTIQNQICGPDNSSSQYLPLATQRFTLQMSSPSTWSQPGDFSDSSGVGASQAYYGSVQLADVNGDGYADACVRVSAGLACALNNRAGGFGPLTLWSSAFSDAAGFGTPDTGGTLRLVDLNGTGFADVCARTPAGIVCALNNRAGGFGAPTLWSNAFSDAAGYGPTGSNWRTIRFGDITGDGFADVCGRESGGIRCATNTRAGSFGTSSLWNTTDFTDSAGFGPVQYSSTMQLGDITGSKMDAICLRGPNGIQCAISTGSSFINTHQWSFRTDFADSAGWGAAVGYYDSIRIADVTGDGYADLCARGPNGIVCAISNGLHFDSIISIQPNDFTDAKGYQPDPYGTTLSMGDLNKDGKADVCARNANGLVCSEAP